jgi:hypothetical protein
MDILVFLFTQIIERSPSHMLWVRLSIRLRIIPIFWQVSIVVEILEEHIAPSSTLKMEAEHAYETSVLTSITLQNIVIFIVSAVMTLNLTWRLRLLADHSLITMLRLSRVPPEFPPPFITI